MIWGWLNFVLADRDISRPELPSDQKKKKFPHVNVFGKFCPRVFFGGLGNVGIRLSHFLILPHDPHVAFVWPKWWNFIWNGPCDENKANAQFSPGQCWGSKSRQVKVLNVPLTCPNVGYRIRNKTVNHLNCLQLATKCQNWKHVKQTEGRPRFVFKWKVQKQTKWNLWENLEMGSPMKPLVPIVQVLRLKVVKDEGHIYFIFCLFLCGIDLLSRQYMTKFRNYVVIV